jgi:hypothetical protein
VFTARYALSPYIKQTRFVFKGLIEVRFLFMISGFHRDVRSALCWDLTQLRLLFCTDVSGQSIDPILYGQAA